MNDLKQFIHGEEGTHSACQSRIKKEGGKAKCCYCVPHKDCDLKPMNKKVHKIHKRSDFIRCPNCLRGISIKEIKRDILDNLYGKIVDEWADVAEIKLETIKGIIEEM